MIPHARTLLLIGGITAATLTASVASAATGLRAATSAATTTTTTKTTASTVKAASSTTVAKTVTTVKASTAAKGSTSVAATTVPAVVSYRVQAGAARTRAGGLRLAAAATKVAGDAGLVVVKSAGVYRVVSGCRTLVDANALAGTLTAKSLPALVYRSQRC